MLFKINNEYRFQILIKNKLGEKGHRLLAQIFNSIILPKDIKMSIDVDPLDVI